MSLRLFEKLEAYGNGYTLSVIAAAFYSGDIALRAGDYKNAGERYLQCARLCEDKGFYRGLGLHLSMSAWCALLRGDSERARENIASARPFFERFRSHRGAGMCAGEIAFGLSALFRLREDLPGQALEDLRRSEELSDIIQKPLYNAIHFCIKALLKERGHPMLEPALPHGKGHYLLRARKLFEALGLPGETIAFFRLKKF